MSTRTHSAFVNGVDAQRRGGRDRPLSTDAALQDHVGAMNMAHSVNY